MQKIIASFFRRGQRESCVNMAAAAERNKLLIESLYGINLFAEGTSEIFHAPLIAKIRQVNERLDDELLANRDLRPMPRYLGFNGSRWFAVLDLEFDGMRSASFNDVASVIRYVEDMPHMYSRFASAQKLQQMIFPSLNR